MAITINASNNTGLVVTPDNTSVIQFQSNGTAAMTIANTRYVGIGTTTPSWNFVVSNAGAEGLELIPAVNSGENRIQSYNRSGSAYNRLSTISSDFVAYTNGGATTAMTIDSTGRMTRPSHPAFIALSTSGAVTYTSGQKVVYNQLIKDYNSNYSTANSRFTAPVAGLYMFKAQLWMYSTNLGAARFAVNGTQIYGSYGNESQSINFNGIAMVEIFYLNANDYVEVFCRFSTIYTDSGFSTFSGFLIG